MTEDSDNHSEPAGESREKKLGTSVTIALMIGVPVGVTAMGGPWDGLAIAAVFATLPWTGKYVDRVFPATNLLKPVSNLLKGGGS